MHGWWGSIAVIISISKQFFWDVVKLVVTPAARERGEHFLTGKEASLQFEGSHIVER